MIEPILNNAQEDWVVAHELAHQWWRNLVTCADWSQFWLNEGVVVFMTAAWKEHKHGRAAYDREMELARRRLQFAKDAGFDKPLA
jgi:aminopeptidase N